MKLPKNCMMTGNGIVVDLINPKKEQIRLKDISSSLAKICRYSGGTIHFYSVAQHSLNCCKIAREMYDEKTGLYLLLHDAGEAYISGIATPVKKNSTRARRNRKKNFHSDTSSFWISLSQRSLFKSNK